MSLEVISASAVVLATSWMYNMIVCMYCLGVEEVDIEGRSGGRTQGDRPM